MTVLHVQAGQPNPFEFSEPAGRAAVVVPNGTLFADGICGRIKRELLTAFNLHTIVRLPSLVQTLMVQ